MTQPLRAPTDTTAIPGMRPRRFLLEFQRMSANVSFLFLLGAIFSFFLAEKNHRTRTGRDERKRWLNPVRLGSIDNETPATQIRPSTISQPQTCPTQTSKPTHHNVTKHTRAAHCSEYETATKQRDTDRSVDRRCRTLITRTRYLVRRTVSVPVSSRCVALSSCSQTCCSRCLSSPWWSST